MASNNLAKFRLIALTSCATLALAGAAMAQPAKRTHLNIPAESLGVALNQLAQQSQMEIVFNADLARGKRAEALSGDYTPQEALARLLRGSGLRSRMTGSGSFVVESGSPSGVGPKNDPSPAVQEVVVTAQRRKEQLQDVPIAVTAISSSTLYNQRITSIEDVSRLTPGLTISSYSYSKPDISLRGSYNNVSQIGVDTPVAVVLDDVYITRPGGQIFNLYDLDSVQVLRGPQGTLFGRNVTGGAIVLTTSKPSFTTPQYSAEVGYGNYNEVEFNGLVSEPIGDNMAAKFVVSHTSHDGYGYDRLSGQQEDNLDNTNLRAQFRARAGDIETLFSADYSTDDNGGRTLASFGLGSTGNPRISDVGIDQYFKRQTGGISNSTIWTIPGDKGTVTAITAFRDLDFHEVYSQSGVSYLFLTSGSQSIYNDANRVEDLSEEVRYNSPKWTLGDFIAGIYYLDDNAKEPLYLTGLAAKTGALASSTAAYQFATTSSISGYIDGNINLPANFRLTLGGRYTDDSKTAELNYVNVLKATGSFDSGRLERNFSEFTPRAVLSWKIAPEYLLYGSVTRGFTSGGFDTGDTTLAAVSQGFQPETVTSYETGVKSSFLDRRITADLAVFDMDFHNKQEFVFNSLTAIGNIINAARATSKGAELEVGLHPIHGLDLDASYAALDTKYNSFVVPGLLNYTGNQLGYSPRNKASVALHYERPVGDLGFAIANFSYAWTETYDISASTTQLAVPSYGLVNLNLAYETPDRRYRFSIWSKNLTNETYELVGTTTGTLAYYYGPPRTFGGTISARF